MLAGKSKNPEKFEKYLKKNGAEFPVSGFMSISFAIICSKILPWRKNINEFDIA